MEWSRDLRVVTQVIKNLQIMKAPPGPPPNPHWVWHEETRRWRNPANWEESVEHPKAVEESDWNHPRFSDLEASGKVTYDALVDIGWEVGQQLEVEGQLSYVNINDHESLLKYASASYRNVNLLMKEPGRKMTDEMAAYSMDIIHDMNQLMQPLGESQVLYRGLPERFEQRDVIRQGEILEIDSFLSCSRNPSIATEFIDEEGTFIELYASGEARGITLSNYDTTLPEDETILDTGQKFVVEESYPLRIYMEGYNEPKSRYTSRFYDVTYVRGRVL